MTNKSLYRPLRILFYLVILIALMIYGQRNNPTLTLQECLDNPAKYDNATLEIANEITVQSIDADGFVIHQAGNVIRVMGDAPGIHVNDYIALRIVFHREGWLELKDFHVPSKRRAKIWISVLPVLLVLYLFFKAYTFQWRGAFFRERA